MTSLRNRKSVQNLSAFFTRVFTNAPDATEGLYWLSIWSADASLDNAEFNTVLQQLVISHMLKDEGAEALFRLRNASPVARGGSAVTGAGPIQGGPCTLLARMKDVEMLWTSQALQKLAIGRRDGDQPRVFGTEAKTFELMQRYEGRRGIKTKGTCIVAVLIELGDGQAAEIEAWYRREHLGLLANMPIYLRSTRYRLRTGLIHGANDSGPTLLALHEYTSHKALLEYAMRHGQIAPETRWSAAIFANVKSVERTIWDITGKYSQPDLKLDKL